MGNFLVMPTLEVPEVFDFDYYNEELAYDQVEEDQFEAQFEESFVEEFLPADEFWPEDNVAIFEEAESLNRDPIFQDEIEFEASEIIGAERVECELDIVQHDSVGASQRLLGRIINFFRKA